MPALNRAPQTVRHWDDEVDVLVVGMGVAGAAATLDATALGLSTMIVERGGGGGGTSAMSGGVIYMGGGTPLQQACGFEDTPDEMFKFLMASCGENPDEAKIRLYCDGSVDQYDWLTGHGVPFKQTYYHGVSGEPPTSLRTQTNPLWHEQKVENYPPHATFSVTTSTTTIPAVCSVST